MFVGPSGRSADSCGQWGGKPEAPSLQGWKVSTGMPRWLLWKWFLAELLFALFPFALYPKSQRKMHLVEPTMSGDL